MCTYIHTYIHTCLYINIFTYIVIYVVNDIPRILPLLAAPLAFFHDMGCILGPGRARMPMTAGPAGPSCKRQRPVRLKVPDQKRAGMKPEDCTTVCVSIISSTIATQILSFIATRRRVCSHCLSKMLRFYPALPFSPPAR